MMIAAPLEEVIKPTGPAPGPVKPIPTVIRKYLCFKRGRQAETACCIFANTQAATPAEWQVAGDGGHRALWVVFAILLIASAVFAGLSWKVTVSRRVYHVLTTVVTVIGALSYFALASGQGNSLHRTKVADHHDKVPDTYHDVYRQVFWARYVDWALTTPLILLELSLLAGLSGANTLIAVLANFVFVLGGLFSAFGREHTPQKWGWYAIAWISYVVVIWHVGFVGSRTVKAKDSKVVKHFGSLAAFTLILWTVYPM